MSDDHETEESLEEMEFTRKKAVHAVVSFGAVILVAVLMIGSVVVLTMDPLEAEKANPEQLIPLVDLLLVHEEDKGLEVMTQGVVESVKDLMISAEVGGRVVYVSSNLLKGASVEKGEVLVEIEKADYEAALERAVATRDEAALLLAQEEARKEQAERDWEKLGRGEQSLLSKREPHIKAAKARLRSAEAEVGRAGRDLDRTRIAAPFSGVVSQESVEMGAVLAPGSMVAQVYSMDELEVRLPVSMEDFGVLARDEEGAVVGDVRIAGVIGLQEYDWSSRIVRTDGQVDSQTLSATVIVQIDENGDNPAYLRFPPAGMFLKASIPGTVLENVIELPREALRDGTKVLVVREMSKSPSDGEMEEWSEMEEIRVNVLRTTRETVLVREESKDDDASLTEGRRSSLKDGDRVILTRMGGAVSGAKVELAETYESIPDWREATNPDRVGEDNGPVSRDAEEEVIP